LWAVVSAGYPAWLSSGDFERINDDEKKHKGGRFLWNTVQLDLSNVLQAVAVSASEVVEEDVEQAKQAAQAEAAAATEAAAGEAVSAPRAPQTAAEIMAAAAKTAEDRTAPLCSSRMMLARSLVARQEQLYDRLAGIRRQFADIDAEVTSLRAARYAHYARYEERARQQQAHNARARLITGR